MAFLFDQLHFPEQSRLTGVWQTPWAFTTNGDLVAFAQLLELPTDQDPCVEADFFNGHLPYCIGGLYGVYPDGQGWIFIIQCADVESGLLVGATNPWWPMLDGLDRALHLNPRATKTMHVAWTHPGVIDAYQQQAVPRDVAQQLPLPQLLLGLLAECCDGDLNGIVAAYPNGCSLPHIAHDCTSDPFTDIFSHWSADLTR